MRTDVLLYNYNVLWNNSDASTVIHSQKNRTQKTHLEALITLTITVEVKYLLITVSLDLFLTPILI